MTVEQQIDAVIEREGGFVNHPDDKGGATRFGITEAVARTNGWKGAMQDLPRAQAIAIYRRLYWERPGLDKVAARAPVTAAEMFDTGVNMGPSVAATFLQRALNALNRGQRDYPDLAVDGRIGPVALSALDAFVRVRGALADRVLARAMDALQGERYVALAEGRERNESFLFGWLSERVAL